MKAVIPVAGHGTRMLPITKSVPKELLPVGNKPVIQYVVEGIVSAGVQDIVMVTSQGKMAIEDYFDKNYELEDVLKQKGKTEFLEAINRPKSLANLCFVKQKKQLGFPHAVWEAKPWVDSAYFMLSIGDSIFHPHIFQEMMQVHKDTGKAVIALQAIDPTEIHKYGVAEVRDGHISSIIEKPQPGETDSNLINIGVYILPTKIFDVIPKVPIDPDKGEITFPDVFTELMKTDQIVPYVTPHPFWDTGTPENRMQCCRDLEEKNYLADDFML